MKRIPILMAISIFLCSTASAFQDGGGISAKNPKPLQSPPSAPKLTVEPQKESQSSPAAKPPMPVKLTARDMQIIFQELVPPQKQQQIASDPEGKKKLVSEIKKLLAVAHVAEQEGYAERPDIKSQLSFQQELDLSNAYRKKNADAKASDQEVNAYLLAHPKDFDDFLQSNPRFEEQAQGPQRDKLKRQYGEFKVIAERARKEGVDRDDATRLQMILDQAQVLAAAYISELQKDADKLVSGAEVNKYYQDHLADFDEVRVRHILIGTQPEEEHADDNDAVDNKKGKDKKPVAKPQVLNKEEARKKAQLLLDRVRKGEDFAKLAKENSDDPGSKDNGGEYDFFGRDKMVPEFEKAAFALKPGEVSGLVETQFGFHIIKLEARRTSPLPASDQNLRQQITSTLLHEKIEARISEIANKSTVVVPEDFDTTPKPGAPPPKSKTNPVGDAQQMGRDPKIDSDTPGRAVDSSPVPTVKDVGQSLTAFRGKVVILNFWATWAGPCRVQILALVALQDKYRDQGLELVGVSIDPIAPRGNSGGAPAVAPFVKANGINYHVWMVDNAEAFAGYDLSQGIPLTYVLDREGSIVKKYVGTRSMTIFEDTIKPMLNKPEGIKQ